MFDLKFFERLVVGVYADTQAQYLDYISEYGEHDIERYLRIFPDNLSKLDGLVLSYVVVVDSKINANVLRYLHVREIKVTWELEN